MNNLLRWLVLAIALSGGHALAAIRYVDPANPAAQDAGEGDAKRPYRSLAYAVKRLRPGDTLNIAPGTYRESLIFPDMSWSGAPTSVQPVSKGAEVLIKGSDRVGGWERVEPGLFVKRRWTVNSQQVFVDGESLKQIGGTILNGFPDKPGHPMKKLHQGQGGIWPGRVPGGIGEMTENSFHYDAGAQSLYVKIEPAGSLEGRTVEVSVRPYLVLGKGVKALNFANLRFQHANTTAVSQSGAISLAGDRILLEGIEVSHVDGAGLDITGNENTVRGSRASYCGQVGMKLRGGGAKVIDNETSFNNTRGFNTWWEAGGAKFVGHGGLHDSEIRGHRSIGNNGDGIWFDWMNSNNKVHDSVSAYNAGFGIHYEASQKGHITNNRVFGNKRRGIYLPHSSGSIVAHNLVAKNGMEGIVVVDEGRSKNKPELRPRGNRVIGNILAWNNRSAVVLPAGLLENISDYNLYLSSREPPGFSLGWASKASPVRKGLEAWRAASRQDMNSWSESFEIPKELLLALEKRQPDADWSGVMKLASRFSVLAADAAGGNPTAATSPQLTPGPRP
jgi:parallel beta-helix repeat protein